jgi:4-hydroxybenzoate polyprenyltransferase
MKVSGSVDVPLCVDCDGTLVRTDLLYEALLVLLKRSPHKVLNLPFWLLRGKAYTKQKIASEVELDWPTIPLNDAVIALARGAREAGRKIVLATASHRRLAEGIAAHLGLFDEVLATDGDQNLSGAKKGELLASRFGVRGFDYVGDGRRDLHVWSMSRSAIVVSSSAELIEAARGVSNVERIIPRSRPGVAEYLRSLRLHQWLKNMLVFVPIVAAHRLGWDAGLVNAGLAFVSFGLCASAVYVVNDLMDLESDRRHIRKRFRPFASARIPLWQGAVIVPVLLAAGFAIAACLPLQFIGVLLLYMLITTAYSLVFKRQVIVDVLILAGLYTLRVVGGGAATEIVPSFWLLAFSMFIFLSLAMVKRYSELLVTLANNKTTAAGRGYAVTDLPVLMSAGTSSGVAAVLVMALYINNPDSRSLYPTPEWLWLVPPLLLYWVARVWMKAHRGEIDDDPVVFAIRDWQSIVVVILGACLFVMAANA